MVSLPERAVKLTTSECRMVVDKSVLLKQQVIIYALSGQFLNPARRGLFKNV